MTLLKPHYLLTPTTLLENQAILFDEKIVSVGDFEALSQEYPQAEIVDGGENSLVMPGLINAHVHLEFSANKTTLEYGSFMPWLRSVIANRETLVNNCDNACMRRAVTLMLQNGITTFGAISSNGFDLEVAEDAPQNVVYFNELIGTQSSVADILYNDFLQRLDASKSVKRKGFYPAIAIHSPYSVHPVLIRRALEVAQTEGLKVSAHYLESPAEREWVDQNSGDFAPFFKDFLKQEHSANTSAEYLDLLQKTPTLMTHVVHANESELKRLRDDGHTVVHCPISNRLLGNGAIDLDALESAGISWLCATDGLSSNYTLDLFEEMKIALFMHHGAPLLPLAKKLIESVTCKAADALGLPTGRIESGYNADLLLLRLDETPNEQLPIHLLLHRYEIESVYINGSKAF